jgi:hypothetical protein
MRLWQVALAGFVGVPVVVWWIEAVELHFSVRRWRKEEQS